MNKYMILLLHLQNWFSRWKFQINSLAKARMGKVVDKLVNLNLLTKQPFAWNENHKGERDQASDNT